MLRRTTERTLRQQYHIPVSLVDKVRSIAKREKVTSSEIVRRALTAYEEAKPAGTLAREMRGIHRLLIDLAKSNRRTR